MKRRIVVMLCITLLMCAVLVSCKDNEEYPPCGGVITDEGDSYSELEFEASGTYESGNSWFIGEVLEVGEDTILVKPHKNAAERKSADKIWVSTDVKEGDLPSTLRQGAIVRVGYDGAIAESYPAQINSTVRLEAYYASESSVGIILSGHSESSGVRKDALNADLIGIGKDGTTHYPVHKISSIEELRAYLDRCASIFSLADPSKKPKGLADDMLIAKYDSEFFTQNELFIAYITASSGSYRYSCSADFNEENNSFTMYITKNLGGIGVMQTADVASWLAVAEFKKESIPEDATVDAISTVGIVATYSYIDPEQPLIYSSSIVLMEGDRYSMTFGALSSHIGMGTYEIKDGQLCLTEGNSGDTYVFSLSEDGSKAIFKKDMSTGRSWYSSFTDGSEFNYIGVK